MRKRMSDSERRLRLFGRWIVTPVFAVGSGMITTVAVSSISIIASLALPWLIPILALVFLAESAISIYLFRTTVPDTLTAIFIHGIFKNLSHIKQGLLFLGVFSALGGGLALGALTYTSGVTAIGAVLGLFSLSCPPVAIGFAAILAVFGFIALTSLLIKWIAVAIRTDMHLQVLKFFKNLVTRDLTKPLSQQVLENVFKCLFTTSIFLLSIVGTIATLGTMQHGLVKFFSLIPNANLLAVKISSSIIAYALLGVARLPWALQSVCTVFSKLGEMAGKGLYYAVCQCKPDMRLIPKNEQKKQTTPSWKTIGIYLLKASAVVVHGVSFGALAKSGGGQVITDLMTDMHFPLDPTAMDLAGQGASMVAGTMMASGIGAYTLFAKPNKPVKEKQENSNDRIHQKGHHRLRQRHSLQ